MGKKQNRNTRQLTEEERLKVIENLDLVHYVLKRYFYLKPYLDIYQDYFQEGCLGLMYSVVKFDDTLGYSFSTYAVPNIRGHIQRYKRDREHMIHISRGFKDKCFQVLKLQNEGYSLEEIPEKMGISSLELLDIVNSYSLSSLNSPIENEPDNATLEDVIYLSMKNDISLTFV